MKFGIIYKITNIINNKCYIGQTTKTLECRKHQHIIDHKKYKSNTYLYRSIRKYGIDNFKWEILCECENKLLLNVMETFKIMVNNSHMSENGYNMTWGGDGQSIGYSPSIKIRQLLSECGKKTKGIPKTEEHRKKMPKFKKGNIPWNKGCVILINDVLDKFSEVQRKYSDDIILQAKKFRDDGLSYNEISKKINIHPQSIYYWFKKSRISKKLLNN